MRIAHVYFRSDTRLYGVSARSKICETHLSFLSISRVDVVSSNVRIVPAS